MTNLKVKDSIDKAISPSYRSNDDSEDEAPTLINLDPDVNQNGNDSVCLQLVPVTILSGFLGSGKTTLIRNILTSKEHQKRIAVIENEYGGGESGAQLSERFGLTVNDVSTLSIETMIARDGMDNSTLTDFVELPNGCICCTVKDTLVLTLENLLSKRTDLDYIIIEASGMADPGPVASIFWLDEALESRLRLDGIVVCVDARNILLQLDSTSSSNSLDSKSDASHKISNGDEAARQIAFADRIIINKIDLLGNNSGDYTGIERIISVITSINPTAPTMLTTFSKITDLSWVLDTKSFDVGRYESLEHTHLQISSDFETIPMNATVPINEMSNNRESTNNLCGLCGTDSPNELPLNMILRSNPAHYHTAIKAINIFRLGSVDLQKINSWLATVLWPNQDEMDHVLRARIEHGIPSSPKNENVNIPKNKTEQYVYRVKGVLSVQHTNDQLNCVQARSDWYDEGVSADLICRKSGLDRRRFIIQAVNDTWDITPTCNHHFYWNELETRCCKVVVIGKHLDNIKLREGLYNCFCTAD